MAEISRVALFGKLNPICYRAMESATVFCKMRGNPYVELVHWFHQILQIPDSDLMVALRHFEVPADRLAKDIVAALDRLPGGAGSVSDLSAHVEDATEKGWSYASLLFGRSAIRSGDILLGVLRSPGLKNALHSISDTFRKISPDELAENFDEILGGSAEAGQSASDGSQLAESVGGDASAGGIAPASMGKQEALQQFCVDLTEQARTGEIDNIVGRDEEIRQLVDILMRRRQNNPILTGEAGVGKTAVVEGFALRLANDDVPPSLKGVRLLSLDIGLLQAGASMKGEFEKRLQQVIEEVQTSTEPIILFVDEAHTLIGAGGAAGTGDAANLMKPALARGTLRTIAATTWAEYKKHIEKDPALTRRFQVVKVEEPDEHRAIQMMRSLAGALEKHHRVQLLDEAIEAAVQLSMRYIPARQLPDKSVSLLDTACARVAISQHAVPAEVEDAKRRLEALEREKEIIAREAAVGVDTEAREARVAEEMAEATATFEAMEARWQAQKTLVDEILSLREALRAGGKPVDEPPSEQDSEMEGTPTEQTETDDERAEKLERLRKLQGELEEIQGDQPLIMPSVDEQAIALVVGAWTGIPVGRMVKDEMAQVLSLSERLKSRVIGQDHGLEMVSRRVQTSRAKLDNPSKPIGVFMLCGPSGVGKTETALALAETLYGGEQNMITINMSEFQEGHTVSTLKGAPPGYVGYGEGGILTEAVRRRPYSVVLLDEVEKAHPDVHEIFFQVFDKGIMEDGEGRLIDFKNTLILLTSNVGSDLIQNMCSDPELIPAAEGLAEALREPLLKTFPAALLGRIVTIPYYPLAPDVLEQIIRLQLGRVEKRVSENYDIPFTYDDDVVKLIASRCTQLESGGRMIDAIITNTILPEVSKAFLTRMMNGEELTEVKISAPDKDFVYHYA
ncbi:MAG: type VI secretion system ATPase TssH [Pseudomonadota bacterium]